MNQYAISQVPVIEDGKFVGSLTDNQLFAKLLENPELKELPVKNIMGEPFPMVDEKTDVISVSKHFQQGAKAVIVSYDKDKHHIITQQDMIKAIDSCSK